jgi:O-antigen biosynthesis protein
LTNDRFPDEDPNSHRALSSLENRLSEAEEAISHHRDAQKRIAALYSSLRNDVEAARFAQNRLEAELIRQGNEIRGTATTVHEILQSRIWRMLVNLGGFVLRTQLILSGGVRNQRLQSPVAESSTGAQPPQKAPPPILRASASRHSLGATTISDWKEVIGTVAAGRSPSSAPKPRISIITPVWNTKAAWFAEAAISVLEQSFSDWEWCIVDDGSTSTEFHDLFQTLEDTGQVKILKLEKNQGISGATNEGLRLATGDYVCCLDHDDLLVPAALAECVEMLDLGFDAVYTDSDKVDETGLRSEPFHKPDWSPEYFRGVMFVGHLLAVRRNIAQRIGGFDSKFNGIQDFEFMLRFSEQTHSIGHVSSVLYHWRTVEGSIASAPEAKGKIENLQRAAVQAQLTRLSLPATAEIGRTPHRIHVQPMPLANHPKVSIIIPTKDAPELLQKCLSSLFEKTKYPEFEVICVDNGTSDIRALHLMRTYPVKRLLLPGRFNFSRANNLGVHKASGEYLVFMNNDIEVIGANWIEEMLYYARQEDVGAVGALLLYPDRTIQHAGVVLGCRGTADHVLRYAPADSDGYAGSVACAREVSAVTAACMMMKRETFEQAGGFNEHYFTAYQDADLCLSLRSLGKRNIITPRAILLHLESKSRGNYYDFVDRNLLLDRWEETISSTDPYYNRNFDVEACDYSLRSV